MALQVSINGANRLLVTTGSPSNISTDDRSINISITAKTPRSSPPIADIMLDDAIEIIALFYISICIYMCRSNYHTGQCLKGRIDDIEVVSKEVLAWQINNYYKCYSSVTFTHK